MEPQLSARNIHLAYFGGYCEGTFLLLLPDVVESHYLLPWRWPVHLLALDVVTLVARHVHQHLVLSLVCYFYIFYIHDHDLRLDPAFLRPCLPLPSEAIGRRCQPTQLALRQPLGGGAQGRGRGRAALRVPVRREETERREREREREREKEKGNNPHFNTRHETVGMH